MTELGEKSWDLSLYELHRCLSNAHFASLVHVHEQFKSLHVSNAPIQDTSRGNN